MYKVVGFGVLILAGVGGYSLYKKYGKSDDSGAEDDVSVADSILGTYVPFLPIHPRSVGDTSGVFKKPVHNGYKNGITTARDTDWINPAQIYASTGPTGLAPIAAANGSDFKRETIYE